MTHKIYFTANFKRQYKKARKNPRWRPIFEGQVPFDEKKRSPWSYIRDSFVNRVPLPAYFYVHSLHVPRELTQRLKRDLGLDSRAVIRVLELHLDGHNGDHLLVYYDDEQRTTYIALGTHSELF